MTSQANWWLGYEWEGPTGVTQAPGMPRWCTCGQEGPPPLHSLCLAISWSSDSKSPNGRVTRSKVAFLVEVLTAPFIIMSHRAQHCSIWPAILTDCFMPELHADSHDSGSVSGVCVSRRGLPRQHTPLACISLLSGHLYKY